MSLKSRLRHKHAKKQPRLRRKQQGGPSPRRKKRAIGSPTRALVDEICNENAAKADQRRKEAEKRLNAAAEYIIEKAAQA